MHSRYSHNQLRPSKNHTGASKYVIDQIEGSENDMARVAISFSHNLQGCMSMRCSHFGQHAQDSHQSNLEGQAGAEPHWGCEAELVAHDGREDRLIDPHPRREDGRACETRANRSIGDHEHLGPPRVFHQIQFLNLDGEEDNSGKKDTETNDDSIPCALAEQADSIADIRHLELMSFPLDSTNRKVCCGEGREDFSSVHCTLYQCSRPTFAFVLRHFGPFDSLCHLD